MHLPRRYKKRIARLEVVALVALQKIAVTAVDEVQLILRVGLLRVVATRGIQLGAHTAMGQDHGKTFARRAWQVLQSLFNGVFHRTSFVWWRSELMRGVGIQSTMNNVAPRGALERWGSA